MFKWLYRKYLLRKIRLNRIERLISLEMDMDYFQKVIKHLGNEEALRKQIADERSKDIKEQDIELINTLNTKIERVVEATKNLNEYAAVSKEIEWYLNYIKVNGDTKMKETQSRL
jgi:hypothetical protein